jgi:CheY-like chemotaxis protein
MSESQRRTILIVDDDPDVTRTFARMLALDGYEVHTAHDAESGQRAIDASHPDAILLDLRMPLVGGLGFLRQLRTRSDCRKTPVAVITGDYQVDAAVSCALRELGADVYLKPVWLEDLLDITRRLLSTPAPRSSISRCLRLLLVDDCAAERDLYETALETEFSIVTASRGDEGVTVAKRVHPDAIILDVLMPGIDGWETCTRIKGHPDTKDIPVILLTGADDRDLSQHAKAVGASAVLRKPCPADRLRDEIRAVSPSRG